MSFFPNKGYSIGQVNSHTFTVHFCGQMLFHLHRFYDDDPFGVISKASGAKSKTNICSIFD